MPKSVNFFTRGGGRPKKFEFWCELEKQKRAEQEKPYDVTTIGVTYNIYHDQKVLTLLIGCPRPINIRLFLNLSRGDTKKQALFFVLCPHGWSVKIAVDICPYDF